MKKILFENGFGLIAFFICTIIFLLFNFTVLNSFIFKNTNLLILLMPLNFNKLIDMYFAVSLIYLGVITLEKIFTPVNEILKEKIINEKTFTEKISRKKFIYWIWVVIIIINIVSYFIASFNRVLIPYDISQILMYFFVITGVFIAAQNLSPYLKEIKSPLEENGNTNTQQQLKG